MSTTKGDSSHMYCTEGGNSKSVNTMSEVLCSPDLDSSKEEKERFMKVLENYMSEETPTKVKK